MADERQLTLWKVMLDMFPHQHGTFIEELRKMLAAIKPTDKDGNQYVIWTRYERPNANSAKRSVVRHAYGPYPTRAKAQAELKRMMQRHEEDTRGHDVGLVEAHVTTLIGDKE